MELIGLFANLVFVGLFALLPVVNPPGTALMVEPLLGALTGPERKSAAKTIAFYCFGLCTAATLAGSWVFRLFGISLPVVQLAGGVFIAWLGWLELVPGDAAKGSPPDASPLAGSSRTWRDSLFYPLTFPMTTGPGTVSVLLTLSAHGQDRNELQYLVSLVALIVAIGIVCVLVFVSYAYAPALLRRLGPRATQIANRLSAFLVFCVGLQIAATGIEHLVHNAGG